jgi:hypothetical protein
MRPLPFDASHQDAFLMYWGCQLKISIALNPKKKRKSLRIHLYSVSLPPCGHTFHHSLSTYTDSIYYLEVPTLYYFIILLWMYLHSELLLLLHLPFESSKFPHLVTIRLDLAQTISKYPYFIALMDLSYLTHYGTTFCSPYS